MNIEIYLNTAYAEAGVDRDALLDNLQAEIENFSKAYEGVSAPQVQKKEAPEGAQGEFELIQWVVAMATDPKMAIVYARTLIFAINEIVSAARGNKAPSSTSEKDKVPVRFILLGKEISLPATTAAIKAFLEQLGG